MNTNDAYAAMRIRDFRFFVFARFLLTFAIQMQSVIVGWQIYHLTHDAFSLGLIGLTEAIPFLSVALFAGHAADNINRKKIILVSYIIYFVCAFILFTVASDFLPAVTKLGIIPIYTTIFISGLTRAFIFPAQAAFAAQIVPKELFGNASTWNSVFWQFAAVSGPAAGGLLVGFMGFSPAYFCVVCLTVVSTVFVIFVKSRPLPERAEKESMIKSLKTGLKFVFSNQIILSAVSLDMFAVFFGGAVTMLPLFADQVLHTGAKGLGFLRAAPAVGAIIMSLIQAYYPPFKKAGRNLLIAVALYGISIICFAISQSFYLSLILLAIGGMFDNISVIVRGTLIQVYTPDELRGRVSAVNGIFIGSSNELGSFESGVAAKLLGLIPSVIFGGTMTILVVSGITKFAPKLRKLSLIS